MMKRIAAIASSIGLGVGLLLTAASAPAHAAIKYQAPAITHTVVPGSHALPAITPAMRAAVAKHNSTLQPLNDPTCANQQYRENDTTLLGHIGDDQAFADEYSNQAMQTTSGPIVPDWEELWVLCWTPIGYNDGLQYGTAYLWNYWSGDQYGEGWLGVNNAYGPRILTATATYGGTWEEFIYSCVDYVDEYNPPTFPPGSFELQANADQGYGFGVNWYESYGGISSVEVSSNGGDLVPEIFENQNDDNSQGGTGMCYSS